MWWECSLQRYFGTLACGIILKLACIWFGHFSYVDQSSVFLMGLRESRFDSGRRLGATTNQLRTAARKWHPFVYLAVNVWISITGMGSETASFQRKSCLPYHKRLHKPNLLARQSVSADLYFPRGSSTVPALCSPQDRSDSGVSGKGGDVSGGVVHPGTGACGECDWCGC